MNSNAESELRVVDRRIYISPAKFGTHAPPSLGTRVSQNAVHSGFAKYRWLGQQDTFLLRIV